MKAIIIEDEKQQLELLKDTLATHFPEISIIGDADSVLEGKSLIAQTQPDLVFMDVMIKGGTSFDILAQLVNLDAEVIFTTSYEKYAIQAFRISAIDYLLKPIDLDELRLAIDKVKLKVQSTDTAHHLRLLMTNLKSDSNDVKVALPTSKGYSFISPKEIIRCESDNTYTTFFLDNGEEILVSKTLKLCEQMLEPFTFCRVHNSSLINLKHIQEYVRGEGGVVIMNDGSEVSISRRRKDSFLQLFKELKL